VFFLKGLISQEIQCSSGLDGTLGKEAAGASVKVRVGGKPQR
jgi:hypothetical protein